MQLISHQLEIRRAPGVTSKRRPPRSVCFFIIVMALSEDQETHLGLIVGLPAPGNSFMV